MSGFAHFVGLRLPAARCLLRHSQGGGRGRIQCRVATQCVSSRLPEARSHLLHGIGPRGQTGFNVGSRPLFHACSPLPPPSLTDLRGQAALGGCRPAAWASVAASAPASATWESLPAACPPQPPTRPTPPHRSHRSCCRRPRRREAGAGRG